MKSSDQAPQLTKHDLTLHDNTWASADAERAAAFGLFLMEDFTPNEGKEVGNGHSNKVGNGKDRGIKSLPGVLQDIIRNLEMKKAVFFFYNS